MTSAADFQTELSRASGPTGHYATKGSLLLRFIRASQPITRTEIAERLQIDKSTVTENVKPLVARGIIKEETDDSKETGRRRRVLSFAADNRYFIGVNLGVRRSQVGLISLRGEITDETDFETPAKPDVALKMVRNRIEDIVMQRAGRAPAVIGVSVPGMVDSRRQKLLFAPNLNWRNVDIAAA